MNIKRENTIKKVDESESSEVQVGRETGLTKRNSKTGRLVERKLCLEQNLREAIPTLHCCQLLQTDQRKPQKKEKKEYHNHRM